MVERLNVAAAGPDQSICQTGSATMAASSTGGTTTGQWSNFAPGAMSDVFAGNALFTPAAAQYGSTVALTWQTTGGICPATPGQSKLSCMVSVLTEVDSPTRQCACHCGPAPHCQRWSRAECVRVQLCHTGCHLWRRRNGRHGAPFTLNPRHALAHTLSHHSGATKAPAPSRHPRAPRAPLLLRLLKRAPRSIFAGAQQAARVRLSSTRLPSRSSASTWPRPARTRPSARHKPPPWPRHRLAAPRRASG